MKKLLLIFSVVLGSFLNGATLSNLSFYFEDSTGLCAVTDCVTYASGELDIPEYITRASDLQQFRLVQISNAAFRYCASLTKIIIPSSVNTIESWAFYGCSDLNVVEFKGNKPLSVGYNLFDYDADTYVLVSNSSTGWSNTFDGQKVLSEYTNIDPLFYFSLGIDSVTDNPSNHDLVSKSNYDAVIAERDARPTQASYDAVVAERDAKLSLEEVKDLRAGSTMIEIHNGQATLTMEVEESDDLGIWTNGGPSTLQIPIDAEAGKKFFRFKMTE